MISEIEKRVDGIYKNILILSILTKHIDNCEYQQKYEYSANTFNNLRNELNEYNKSENGALSNYIRNDFETVNEIIYELKNDFNNIFDINVLLLLEKQSINNLIALNKYQSLIKNNFKSFDTFEDELYKTSISKIKTLITDMLDVSDSKFINKDNLKYYQNMTKLDYNSYISIYKLLSTTNKYIENKESFTNRINELLFNVIIIMAGKKKCLPK